MAKVLKLGSRVWPQILKHVKWNLQLFLNLSILAYWTFESDKKNGKVSEIDLIDPVFDLQS